MPDAAANTRQRLTFDQKVAAIQALRGSVGNTLWWRYDVAGWAADKQWYCGIDNVELGGDGFLSSAMGRGATAEAALDDLWLGLTKGPRHVVVGSTSGQRKAWRWVDFMWELVDEGDLDA